MGISKGHKKPRKRSMLGKQLTKHRLSRLDVYINGKNRSLLKDTVKFLRTLDNKDKFSQYAYKIIHKSKQWNAIRMKHITATQVKRICQWKMKSDYLVTCQMITLQEVKSLSKGF